MELTTLFFIIFIFIVCNLCINFFLKRFINFKLIGKNNLNIIRINQGLTLFFFVILIMQYLFFELLTETIFYFLIVHSSVNFYCTIKYNKASKEYLLFANNLIFGILSVLVIFLYRI